LDHESVWLKDTPKKGVCWFDNGNRVGFSLLYLKVWDENDLPLLLVCAWWMSLDHEFGVILLMEEILHQLILW